MPVVNFLNMLWKMTLPPTPDLRFPTRDSHCYIFLQIVRIQPFNMHVENIVCIPYEFWKVVLSYIFGCMAAIQRSGGKKPDNIERRWNNVIGILISWAWVNWGVHISKTKKVKSCVQGLPWWWRFCAPSAGDPGLIPGQGTRSHMPQLRPGTVK